MRKGTVLWPVGYGGFRADAQQTSLKSASAAHSCRHLALVTHLDLSSPVLLKTDSCTKTTEPMPPF